MGGKSEKKKKKTERQDSNLVGPRPCSVAACRDEDEYGSAAMTNPIRSHTGGDRCADVENDSRSWASI